MEIKKLKLKKKKLELSILKIEKKIIDNCNHESMTFEDFDGKDRWECPECGYSDPCF